MCGNNKSCDKNCLAEILETILMLQQQGDECDEDNSCSKPYLGPANNIICLNTRLISFYSCCSNSLWTMPYTLNGEENTSSVFRIESLDDECATFRVLAPNSDQTSNFPYIATEDFFTVKLSCIGALRCLGDTNISGV